MPIGCWICIGVVVVTFLAMAIGCWIVGNCGDE